MKFTTWVDKPRIQPRQHMLAAPVTSLGAFGKKARALCLTFDDGPDPVYTPAILDVLAEHHAKATFFVLGDAARQYPHLIERMIADGHSIGNHTFSHCHAWFTSEQRMRAEITKTSSIIKAITGAAPRWFRPPYGRLRVAMQQHAAHHQMTTVLWNHSIIDWGLLGSQNGIHSRLEKINAGDIVLMHDGQRDHNRPDNLLRLLPDFLASLSDKNLYTWSLDGIHYFQSDKYPAQPA